MKIKVNKNIVILLQSLMPLLWGIASWFFGWGLGSKFAYLLMPSTLAYQLAIAIKVALFLLLIFWLFSRIYNINRRNFSPTLFGYKLLIPSWHFFIALTILAALSSFLFPNIWEHVLINSILNTVIISSIMEELISRSIFVAYPMSNITFIFLSIINAFAFAIMHAGYNVTFSLPSDLAAYFPTSILCALVAFKTKRIEMPIFLHMFHNLFFIVVTQVFGLSFTSILRIVDQIVLIIFALGSSRENLTRPF